MEREPTHRRPARSHSGNFADLVAKLLRERRHELRRLCVHWSRGHGADAEDLLAEACLRALQAAARRDEEVENPLRWLSAIVRNLAHDRWRAPERLRQSEAEPETLPASSQDALDSFASKRLLERALAELRYLPAAQRQSLLARASGEDYQTIARAVGTSAENARKLVQAARHRLRERLRLGEVALTQAT